jgi:hypothetical protein
VKAHRAALCASPNDAGVPLQHAVIVYDDAGGVSARLPRQDDLGEPGAVRHCRLGTVPVPAAPPGTAAFAKAMESAALRLLARVTGQDLRWADARRSVQQIDSPSRNDIDIALGVLFYLDRILGQPPENVRRCRDVARQRLHIPVAP